MGDPEYAEDELSNTEEVKGAVVIVRRGKVPFLTKAKQASRAGALGLIIVDDGRCSGEDDYVWDDKSQLCVVGSVRGNGDGFAREGHPEGWQNVNIPAFLVLKESGDDLFALIGKSK